MAPKFEYFDMNLNQLRAFYTVIKRGTFSSAANELCVTEPAVFIQVRSLERQLGFTLLDRFGKELRPTEVGRLLYEYAEKIFTLVDEASIAVKELQDLKKGALRLGVTNTLAQHLMPFIISSFGDTYPNIAVRLNQGGSEELVQGIVDHRFELAIVARVPYSDRIHVIPFSKEEVAPVVSPQNRLAQKKHVTLEDLAEEPIICTSAGTGTKLLMQSTFEKRGLKPRAIIEAENREFIKHLVKEDRGYAFLGSLSVRDPVEKGELVILRLEGGKLTMDVDIIHLKGKTLSPAASMFLHFMQTYRDFENLTTIVDEIKKKTAIRSVDQKGEEAPTGG